MIIGAGLIIGSVRSMLNLSGMDKEKSFKDKVIRYFMWSYRDKEVVLPLDPFKPIQDAFKNRDKDAPPIGRRIKNFFAWEGLSVFAIIGFLLILLGLFLIFNPGP